MHDLIDDFLALFKDSFFSDCKINQASAFAFVDQYHNVA